MTARKVDGPPPFDFKPDGNHGNEWKAWLRGFEIFAQANSMKKPEKKLNWMLHYAGEKVQSVYYTLPDESEKNTVNIRKGPLASGYVKFQEEDEYEVAVRKLCKFFEPKQSVSFERHVFRQLKQKETERIDMFMMRLREQADKCDFGDQLDENIRDQITSGCHSEKLRRKILERGNQSLEEIAKMARILELVSQQQKMFSKHEQKPLEDTFVPPFSEPNKENVCKIEMKPRFLTQRNHIDEKSLGNRFIGYCGRCGLKGHKASDEKCPAKGKTCNRCGRKDHFARKCFRREQGEGIKRKSDSQSYERDAKMQKREDVQLLAADANSNTNPEDDYDDVFCLENGEKHNKIWCQIGGVDIEVVVDSGTRKNIVDKASWIELKAKNVVTIHRQKEVDINFRSYGNHPLKFIGKFTAAIKTLKKEMTADFYVADEFGKVLLGYETATALGLLRIGYDVETHIEVNTVEGTDEVASFGKFKGIMVDIPIKPDIKGVVQPYRRVPAPLERLVDDKINNLLKQGIIEEVNGVSKWVSPLVIAPKGDNDVRVCVDMRRANMAVERENHPLPTMDDFLTQLGEAKIFSKLDIKQAYHQVGN